MTAFNQQRKTVQAAVIDGLHNVWNEAAEAAADDELAVKRLDNLEGLAELVSKAVLRCDTENLITVLWDLTDCNQLLSDDECKTLEELARGVKAEAA